MKQQERPFPLISHRRLLGVPFGGMRSKRRGRGSDIAGSRLYRPGDDPRHIRWAASARRASLTGQDEFIVRQFHADEAPRVMLVVDRAPRMALYPEELPLLRKPDAITSAGAAIVESAQREHCFVGYIDFAHGDKAFRRFPNAQTQLYRVKTRNLPHGHFRAPEDNLTRAFHELRRMQNHLPYGSFIFVISDFLVMPAEAVWREAVRRGWDIVPVIVQDPLFEQSFPEIGGLLLPVADPVTGRVFPVRLSRREAMARAHANAERLEQVQRTFRRLQLDWVTVDSNDVTFIQQRFHDWAQARRIMRRRGR